MIAYLQGSLVQRHPNRVVLDVHGVGYELHVSVSTFSKLPTLGVATALHVHTHVREDALQLFGFATPREKDIFERLIGVNGVGPKLALAILSGLEPSALADAIRQGDHARLVAIPGVGKKTAERLVLELRDKLAPAPGDEPSSAPAAGSAEADVVSALVNLGYAQPLAEKAVARARQAAPQATFDQLFAQCMKSIGR